jgi:hypothetical protein
MTRKTARKVALSALMVAVWWGFNMTAPAAAAWEGITGLGSAPPGSTLPGSNRLTVLAALLLLAALIAILGMFLGRRGKWQ